MTKFISLLAAAAIAAGMLPGALAADDEGYEPTKTSISEGRYGEYAPERIGQLGYRDSKGVLFFPDREILFDFDRDEVPKAANAEKGSLALSDDYYVNPCKESPNHSLKWTTEGKGSVLTFDANGVPLLPSGYDWRHNYWFGVGMFQEALPEDGTKRGFTIQLLTGGSAFKTFTVYLHKTGWNFFAEVMGRAGMEMPNGITIDEIQFSQISGPAGDVYLDDVILYLCNARNAICMPNIRDEKAPADKAVNYPTHPLTEEEKKAFHEIEERVVPEMKPIEKLADEKMETIRQEYAVWNITETENGFVNGEMPMSYHRAAPGWTVLNNDTYYMNQRAKTFNSSFRTVAVAYNQTQDPEQKAELAKYVVNMAKLALAYGSTPDTWYGGEPFADAVHYGKQALEEAGIASEIAAQLKAQYGTENLLYTEHKWGPGPFSNITTNAGGVDTSYASSWKSTTDDLRNGASSTILSILADEDSPEKARDLYRLKSLLDNILLNWSPGTEGAFKPDGTMFHHNIYKYDYGWTLGWDGATKYCSWLDNTPFQVAPETIERLNLTAETRYLTVDRDRRAGTPDQMIPTMPSVGTMRMAALGMPDGSLEVNPYRASEWLSYSDDSSMGGNRSKVEEYRAMGVPVADMPQTNRTIPYAATNVHRRSSWKVQTYGSGRTIYHNEYLRPATLFYNLAGIPLTVNGETYAMQNKADDKLYGRDDFKPASGYNFNRAPGVTAPDVDPTRLGSAGPGSEEFVGGLSTKNGNGAFTVTFDGKNNLRATNRALYQGTPAEDFRFKKSYFYFNDTIVTMASNIGYGGGSAAVTTGLFQEKATDEDQVLVAGGETLGAEDYNLTYTSDEKPWLTDNILKGGYYLFPGQTYTITRGEQTFLFKEATDDFDGKGRFVNAYIDHPGAEVQNNEGKYSYIILPNATKDKMDDFENGMKSENPPVQIIRQDAKVHAVRSNQMNATGYVFYDKSGVMEEGYVKSVSSPVVVMAQEIENGSGLALSVADPNLRLELDEHGQKGYSQPKDVSVTLNGRWAVKEKATYTAREVSPVTVTYPDENTTLIKVTCKDGATNEYLLENVDQNLSADHAQTLTFTPGTASVLVNGASTPLMETLRQRDGVNYIAIVDVAQLMDSKAEWNSAESRASFYWNDKNVTVTYNSQIATVDSKIIVLEKPVFEENGRYFVPLNFLRDMLKTNVDLDDANNTISYVRNDADWKDWAEEPEPPAAPYLDSIIVDGQPIEEYKKTITAYEITVEDGRETIPEVKVETGDQYKATVTLPEIMPGRVIIDVEDRYDKLNSQRYTVSFVYPKTDYAIRASDTPQPENSAGNTVDNDLESYWTSQMDGCWIEYDVGEEVLFNAMGLAYASGNKRTADFEIEVSSDGQSWKQVYKGTTSGKTLDIEKYSFEPTKGRYIRVVGHGNSTGTGWHSISEAIIYKTQLK